MNRIPARYLDNFVLGLFVLTLQLLGLRLFEPEILLSCINWLAQESSALLAQFTDPLRAVLSASVAVVTPVLVIGIGIICNPLNNWWRLIGFLDVANNIEKNKEWYKSFANLYMRSDVKSVKRFLRFDDIASRVLRSRKNKGDALIRRCTAKLCVHMELLRLRFELVRQVDARLTWYASSNCKKVSCASLRDWKRSLTMGLSICTSVGLSGIQVVIFSFFDRHVLLWLWVLPAFVLGIVLAAFLFSQYYSALFSLVLEIFRTDSSRLAIDSRSSITSNPS